MIREGAYHLAGIAIGVAIFTAVLAFGRQDEPRDGQLVSPSTVVPSTFRMVPTDDLVALARLSFSRTLGDREAVGWAYSTQDLCAALQPQNGADTEIGAIMVVPAMQAQISPDSTKSVDKWLSVEGSSTTLATLCATPRSTSLAATGLISSSIDFNRLRENGTTPFSIAILD